MDSEVLEESQRKRVLKGTNLRIRINLNLKDVVEGVDKKIKVRKLVVFGGVSFLHHKL